LNLVGLSETDAVQSQQDNDNQQNAAATNWWFGNQIKDPS